MIKNNRKKAREHVKKIKENKSDKGNVIYAIQSQYIFNKLLDFYNKSIVI